MTHKDEIENSRPFAKGTQTKEYYCKEQIESTWQRILCIIVDSVQAHQSEKQEGIIWLIWKLLDCKIHEYVQISCNFSHSSIFEGFLTYDIKKQGVQPWDGDLIDSVEDLLVLRADWGSEFVLDVGN